ncbi:hypothetical protein GYA25_01385 [Candidatus Woesearchaeota archaeon]|nr:hypothetical protein [Candidatus Woesearchaeota archaeon]
MVKDKKDVLIRILALGLIILLSVLVYILIVGPIIKNNQSSIYDSGYNQGQGDFLRAMISQIQNQGFVNIPLNQNQSLVLIPYTPQQTQNQ